MRYLKTYEMYNLSTTNVGEVSKISRDILFELSDDGFDVKVDHSSGNYISGSNTKEFIEVTIMNDNEFDEGDIKEVYDRLCKYLETEGYQKFMVASNGVSGNIPHLSVSNFMGSISSFSFYRNIINRL